MWRFMHVFAYLCVCLHTFVVIIHLYSFVCIGLARLWRALYSFISKYEMFSGWGLAFSEWGLVQHSSYFQYSLYSALIV